jgi:GNAT superfamily N-acetyltransferase
MDMTQIEKLPPGAVREAAGVMARAFQDDPAWAWVVPDEERRRRVLPALFRSGLRLESLRGNIVRSTDGAGVAIWVPPHAPRPTRAQMLRSGIPFSSLTLRREERPRLLRYLRANFELRSTALPDSCWLLSGVAVEPGRHGRGIGSALIDWVTQRGVVCGLLTSLPANIPFYERRGFEVVSERADPDGSLRMWAMLRPV